MERNCIPAVWQQGDLIRSESLSDLALSNEEGKYWVLVSHDCDINNADFDKEPYAEVIRGESIETLSGVDSNAKNSRRLDLEFINANSSLKLKLHAATKKTIDRKKLLDFQPPPSKLDSSKLFILRKWLAARYKRAAFANEFNNRLAHRFSRKDSLLKRLENHLDDAGDLIRAVLFDVDQGITVERDASTAYELSIVLLYKSGIENGESCEALCQKIENDFCEAFKKDDDWQQIKLIGCLPMADKDMRVNELAQFEEYKFDHLSMDTEEKQESLLD